MDSSYDSNHRWGSPPFKSTDLFLHVHGGEEEGNVTQAHGTRDEKPRVNPGYSFADNSWQSHYRHHPHSGENYWVIHKRKGLEELKRMFPTASGILSVRNEPLWRYLTLLISET